MARAKCQFCGLGIDKEDLELVEEKVGSNGRVSRKYCHKQCVGKYNEQKAFLEKEKAERNALIQVIKKIHNIHDIPRQFYPFLEKLRNGNVTINNREKKYKEGFDYKLIAQTYIYCRNDILKAKQRIQFDSLFGELKYGFQIVNDKINYVKELRDKWTAEKTKKEIMQTEKDKTALQLEREWKYKKRNAGVDITQFV